MLKAYKYRLYPNKLVGCEDDETRSPLVLDNG